MKSLTRIIRVVLAERLDRDVSKIHSWQQLGSDLDITPLELVLVALDIEEIADLRVPIEELASVRTVGELLSFFSARLASKECLP